MKLAGAQGFAEQNRRTLNTIVNQYNGAIQVDGGINEIQIEASRNVVHFFVNNFAAVDLI